MGGIFACRSAMQHARPAVTTEPAAQAYSCPSAPLMSPSRIPAVRSNFAGHLAAALRPDHRHVKLSISPLVSPSRVPAGQLQLCGAPAAGAPPAHVGSSLEPVPAGRGQAAARRPGPLLVRRASLQWARCGTVWAFWSQGFLGQRARCSTDCWWLGAVHVGAHGGWHGSGMAWHGMAWHGMAWGR